MGQCLEGLAGGGSGGGGVVEEKKTYSWDERRSKIDPKDYILDGLQVVVVIGLLLLLLLL